MFSFNKTSQDRLNTCDYRLREILYDVIRYYANPVIYYRNQVLKLCALH